MTTPAPGTRVELDDPDTGTWHGRVVVCLCKRHAWQPHLGGRECGHAQSGFRVNAKACPWPLHVVWDNGNESHQSAASLILAATPAVGVARRPVPHFSGEAAIYSPEYLARREGNRLGVDPEAWRFVA
jgi:hypothetical protein